MKTKLFISAVGLLLLASCAKTDLYDAEEVQRVAEQTNAEKMFGCKFSPDQDWCSTVSGEVSVNVDASVKKVHLMVVTVESYQDPENPEVTTRTAFKTINQAEPQGRTNITLTYDAPEANDGLFVAFITNDNGYFVSKVENGVASMNNARTRGGNKLTTGYVLPDSTLFHVETSSVSYASERGWNPGELLYQLNDYTNLKMTGDPSDYDGEFKKYFGIHLATQLPNGKFKDNTEFVKNTDEYNNGLYYTSVKGEPIILTPAYKHDQAKRFGNEVFNSDLYYYYYKPEEVTGDFVEFIKSLPKYKVIPFNKVFGEKEDSVVKKHGSYPLPFFKTKDSRTVADANTVCTFKWPGGYKVGFMIQAKCDWEGELKQGEIYGDGRLNNDINKWPNFKSSGFDELEDYPRMFWMTYNGKVFMSWESGTDRDFNDVIIQVEGGTVIPEENEPDLEWFTYCFEDTQNGDYDMNDLVIKATRIDETTVEYRIVACGAYDDIYARNINSGDITDEAEVHELFGVTDHHTFINTDGSNYGYVSCRKKVAKSFTFLGQPILEKPYLYDGTTGKTVLLAGAGESPHGVLIPTDFKYPTEKTIISDAYPIFLRWAVNNDKDADLWYSQPVLSRVR